MNINYKEAQFEFFPQSSGSMREAERPRALAARLTMSTENLVIFSIVSIMLLLLTFSAGVERGKRLVADPAAGQASLPSGELTSVPGLAPENVNKESTTTVDQTVVSRGSFWAGLVARPAAVARSSDVVSDPVATIKSRSLAVSDMPRGKTAGSAGKVAVPVLAANVNKPVKPDAKALADKLALSVVVPVGKFTVQVASYKSGRVAGREAQSLKQKGFRDVYVVPKGTYVIVCVGKFSSKNDASAYTRKLKNRYQETVVRRL